MNDKGIIRYCKKCHCELSSTTKRKLCINCRRERARKIGNGIKIGAGVVTTFALAIISKGKNGGSKKQ